MIDRHLISLAIALQHMDQDVPNLQIWGRAAASALAAGGRLFACGAGASAQQARHVVTELAGPEDDRPPLPVGTLSTVSHVHNVCQSGDVMLCLSATGVDEGVAAAATAAGELGVTTWGLTGPAPNDVAAACAEAVCVDAPATTTVEEVQLAATHIFCAALNCAIRDAVRAGQQLPGSQPAARSGRPAA
ncbi:MAG TPA: phosphoheptose isomerase [Streptosporangiaceae bacterium]|nr:phosphoheptose isomerase [Streptosporangiaceae bacterium]